MAERSLTPVLSSHLPTCPLKALQGEKESKNGEADSCVCILMGTGSLNFMEKGQDPGSSLMSATNFSEIQHLEDEDQGLAAMVFQMGCSASWHPRETGVGEERQ